MKLTVETLSFGYTKTEPIFTDISFSVTTPEIFCILGPNGIGKSTLLKCITGMQHPSTGRILFDGTPLTELSRKQLARYVAYIPQSRTLSFSFPVIDIVTMGRTSQLGYFSSPTKKDMDKAYESLCFLGIEHLADKQYANLSGGEQQLVMIAAAMTQEPAMLLLDEPTSHLDYGNQNRFLSIMKRLSSNGMGIAMTTHYPDHALICADRVMILNHGRIDAVGSAADVITEDNMSKLYRIPIRLIEKDGETRCFAPSVNETHFTIEER